MDQVNDAIVTTLSYSDIFDYPLTKAELWRYLTLSKPILYRTFDTALARASIKEKSHLFFLPGRSGLVRERLKRQKISKKKLKNAQPVLQMLQKIPTIEFIGISGSLAMHNAENNADIDLFIITKPQTLWLTRLLVLSFLQFKRMRRKRQGRKSKNMICVNMLLDTNHLSFPKSRQNLYTAHEIMQVKPFFSRNNTYERFLKKNTWIRKFLPNSFPKTALRLMTFSQTSKAIPLHFMEKLAKVMQIWYMKKHITKEYVSDGFVAFHPQDYTNYVLSELEKRKKKYGLQI